MLDRMHKDLDTDIHTCCYSVPINMQQPCAVAFVLEAQYQMTKYDLAFHYSNLTKIDRKKAYIRANFDGNMSCDHR